MSKLNKKIIKSELVIIKAPHRIDRYGLDLLNSMRPDAILNVANTLSKLSIGWNCYKTIKHHTTNATNTQFKINKNNNINSFCFYFGFSMLNKIQFTDTSLL